MKQKVALVLGCGGARATAHIGVIRELEKQGYEISSISGTSMGALVGGIYAAGKLDEYESWLRSLSKMDIFNLVDFTLSTNGIIKADKVLREIKKIIPDHKIEELPIKFAAVATDLKLRKEVVITEGSLFEAIRASISIPMVITPLRKNDTLFVDGGVLNPVPTNRVSRQKGDILIAVNVNSLIPPVKKAKVDDHPHLGYFEKLTNGKLNEFQNPFKSFTGERTVLKKDILPIVHKMKNSRFGVETLINLYYQAEGKKVKYVMLSGLKHPTKFDKTSTSQAMKEFIMEGHQIALTTFKNFNLITKTIRKQLYKI